jgi:hypothetical protein
MSSTRDTTTQVLYKVFQRTYSTESFLHTTPGLPTQVMQKISVPKCSTGHSSARAQQSIFYILHKGVGTYPRHTKGLSAHVLHRISYYPRAPQVLPTLAPNRIYSTVHIAQGLLPTHVFHKVWEGEEPPELLLVAESGYADNSELMKDYMDAKIWSKVKIARSTQSCCYQTSFLDLVWQAMKLSIF